MSLVVRDVTGRRDLRTFIRLPAKIHRGHRGWVPALYAEERAYLRRAENRAFSYCDTMLALAERDGRTVGRVMGIVNHRYNGARGEANGRFALLEFGADEEAGRALLERIEAWALVRGMSRLVGPMGFSDQDPQGYLLDGFEHEPPVGTYYNFENVHGVLEGAGYSKDMDYVVYHVDLTGGAPEFYRRIAERALRHGACELREFRRKRDLKPYVVPVLTLMNECFRELYGYHELDEDEIRDLARRFWPILDPRFIKIAVSGRRVVGFNIAVPNLAPGFRKARGRLFPFGLLWLLRAGRRSRQLDSMVGGIRKEFRDKGVDAVLGAATMASAAAAGFTVADSHHELEYNAKVRGEMEKIGGRIAKRFRIYGKDLAVRAGADAGKWAGGAPDGAGKPLGGPRDGP